MSSSISCRIDIAGIYRFGTEVRRNQYDKVICIQSKPLILVNTRFRPHIVSLQSCLHDVQKDDFATVLIWVRSLPDLSTQSSQFTIGMQIVESRNSRQSHTHTIIITKGCDISYFFFKTHKIVILCRVIERMFGFCLWVEYIVYILSISTSSPVSGGVKEHEQLYNV